jgi:hypothetical protein
MNPVILTIYGSGDTANYVTVTPFEDGRSATNYMKLMESMESSENSWVRTEWAEPWVKYSLVPNKTIYFEDLIPKLTDADIQKILREVDSQGLVKAIKCTSDEVQEKIENNMSKRAWEMLIEEMDFIGPVTRVDQVNEQKSIISVYQRLRDAGEIRDVYVPEEVIF